MTQLPLLWLLLLMLRLQRKYETVQRVGAYELRVCAVDTVVAADVAAADAG